MKRWILMPSLLATACSVQVLNPQLASNNAIAVKDNAVSVESSVEAGIAVGAAPSLTPGTPSIGSSTPEHRAPSPHVPAPDDIAPSVSPTATPEASASSEAGQEGGASPSPRPSEVPTSGATPTNVATPTPDPRYSPPAFSAVRSFSSSAVYQIRDFSTVIVADGTTIFTTTDAGATWKTYSGIGSQGIRSMSWIDASHGWVVGSSGALLKVTFSDGVARTAILDPGAQFFPYAVHFTSATDGFIACSNNGQIARTVDGGQTWGDGVYVGGIGPGINGFSESAFLPAGEHLAFRSRYGDLFLYRAGAFVKVQPPSMIAPEIVTSRGGRLFVTDKDGTANVYTDDASQFTSIGKDIKTPTQIHRSKLRRVHPVTSEIWLGTMWDGRMSLTRDAGRSWMELSMPISEFDWVHAFSEDDFWALRNNTLYRAGEPRTEK